MKNTTGSSFEKLCDILAQLRAPGGCEWDNEQTLDSLRKYLLEETYEVLETIDALSAGVTPERTREHCEELGDLLLQIIFQAQIQKEANSFTINDVISAITDKLIRRHPHIFSDAKAGNWEQAKAQEREDKGIQHESALDSIPKALPALIRARRIGEKAAEQGFEYPDLASKFRDLRSEIDELEEAIQLGDAAHIEHEIGDALFSVVNVARTIGADSEIALQKMLVRFRNRYAFMENLAQKEGTNIASRNMDQLLEYWREAKKHCE